MSIRNKLYISLIGVLLSITILYAIDTLIVDISWWQSSDNLSGMWTRSMTVSDGDLRYMNKDNDSSIPQDFFSWYYYDPAYGSFKMDSWADKNKNVHVSWETTALCGGDFTWYKLEWYAYNPDFGFIDFYYNNDTFVYLCIPNNENSIQSGSLYGYAYSPYIGFQNFDGISLDPSVDLWNEHRSKGRFLKVDGIVSSQNSNELIWDQFKDDIKILGKLTKSSLRKNIHKKVYETIRNISPTHEFPPYNASSLAEEKWLPGDGEILQNGKVLYFWNLTWENVRVSGTSTLTWNKTLLVEWGNVYITWNIRGSGILGIISLQKDGQWGNIYISPNVTDIHAIIYADRSIISYDGTHELDGNTASQELANQLYIYGSIFSENTIGGAWDSSCPYYVKDVDCDTVSAKKYDLNFLRRYILVQAVDENGTSIGDPIPQFNALESFMWDDDRTNTESQKPWYRVYPVIIEYNPKVQQSPPAFFN